MKDQELEVKYYISDLAALEARVRSLGGHLVQPRVRETNLRFDTPQGSLAQSLQVLRLRQDQEARLTFKGPAEDKGGARLRTEIEFTVGDFETARRFLNALGYIVSMAYEKFRTTYDLDEVHVTLDELPYGSFAELEGPDPERIQSVNRQLGLDWEQRAQQSYTALFDSLRLSQGLPFHDLTFENFRGMEIRPEQLGLKPADVQ
ncbi:MAG TPA: class IV adenylate cyclase [Anaerolineales bacterium]